jgi:hypothetical protein
MDPEAAAEFEENVREMYDQMTRIAITPHWVRSYDFGAGRMPRFLQCGDDGDASDDLGADSATSRPCVPAGTGIEDEAVGVVSVGLDEYAFDPATLRAPVGVVTFETVNNGAEAHELAFLPGGGEVPLTAGGAPDEDALLLQYPPTGRVSGTTAVALARTSG